MIRDGQVPTITREELVALLIECSLEVVKTKNCRRNIGMTPTMSLNVALNELIIKKAETEDET